MTMGKVLNVLIPVLVLGYGVYLAVGMVRRRGCGHCGGCPMAGHCQFNGKEDSKDV